MRLVQMSQDFASHQEVCGSPVGKPIRTMGQAKTPEGMGIQLKSVLWL